MHFFSDVILPMSMPKEGGDYVEAFEEDIKVFLPSGYRGFHPLVGHVSVSYSVRVVRAFFGSR